MSERRHALKSDPLWYKDAIIYELHIKSFFDSNGDGMGDIAGLIERLDYLQDLGVTVLWLLPFYPSPLRDDGYDIADYMNINSDYGDMRDFRTLMREAHKRGLRVVTELVLNHTSDQHEWFQRARRAQPGSEEREYYVWSETSDKYKDARIIFKDFETSNWSWDPVAKAYYWHRFYHHQPDLNYENPNVHEAMFRVIDYWLSLGVDGVRLDAVPYLYEEEDSNCENLPETYEYLKKLRGHIDKKHKDKMLLAEANQWPEDAAKYFGDGDSCHMSFHFPLMPRMFMALQMEDRYPIIDILEQTPEIPENAQWAVFLRNHDELTLEMVTDEERDYMYRMYARDPKARINLGIRRRLAPLLGNDRKKIELMNILLFSMPGTPVLYYGDEIGMGDNYYLGDRDGVRTPMQWSADRNAGFSRSNPQRLFLPVVIDPEYHYEAVNVETQQTNKTSLLWWMKRVIALRKRHPAFGRGSITFLRPENSKVLTFIRSHEDETILVVCNLSRYPQAVTLDLEGFEGCWPEELFSRVRFPQVRSYPYTLTLNPHGYYLFAMRKDGALADHMEYAPPPVLPAVPSGRFLNTDVREAICEIVLPDYLRQRGLLHEAQRQMREIHILEAIPMGQTGAASWLLIIETQFMEGLPEWSNLVVTWLTGTTAHALLKEGPAHLMCAFGEGADVSVLIEGFPTATACGGLAALTSREQSIKGRFGELSMVPGKLQEESESEETITGRWLAKLETSAVVCGDSLFFKVFRHMGEGTNPDAELLRFLTETAQFAHTPKYLGEVQYAKTGQDSMHVAVLSECVVSEADAWGMAKDAVGRYFDVLLARENRDDTEATQLICTPVHAALRAVPDLCRELIPDTDMEFFRLIGQRLGELHLALASEMVDPDFTPEPFSTLYQRSVYQGMQSRVKRTFDLLEADKNVVPDNAKPLVEKILTRREEVLDCLKGFLVAKFECDKIRVHGNLHLGNIYYTGRDVVFANFEGKSSKSLSERRLKRSCLRDIGDVVRSIHHVALTALMQESVLRPEDRLLLEPWADVWRVHAAGAVLRSYLEVVEGRGLVPDGEEALSRMLEAFLLEKAFLELRTELAQPSGLALLPLKAIDTLLG